MDKRALSSLFRERLKRLLADENRSTASFVRDTGIDRSALSQFLDSDIVRLPRAEALRRIASASGVSVDWLLGLENAPEGRQSVTTSFQVEHAEEDGQTPLERWRDEVAGQKLRYVPSVLPDMLNLSLSGEHTEKDGDMLGTTSEQMLAGKMPEDMDIEICLPLQRLHDLAAQTGYWRGASPDLCRRQLIHMARICDEAYPTLRLHAYDGTVTYSAPYTVFGKQRVAVYLGDAFLVLTQAEEIRFFVKRFDLLVRQATVSPDAIGGVLAEMAASI